MQQPYRKAAVLQPASCRVQAVNERVGPNVYMNGISNCVHIAPVSLENRQSTSKSRLAVNTKTCFCNAAGTVLFLDCLENVILVCGGKLRHGFPSRTMDENKYFQKVYKNLLAKLIIIRNR